MSLIALKKCELPKCDVEVIIVINHSENEKEEIKAKNEKTYDQVLAWSEKNNTPRLKFHLIFRGDFPKKHAGVGLARKIGTDRLH